MPHSSPAPRPRLHIGLGRRGTLVVLLAALPGPVANLTLIAPPAIAGALGIGEQRATAVYLFYGYAVLLGLLVAPFAAGRWSPRRVAPVLAVACGLATIGAAHGELWWRQVCVTVIGLTAVPQVSVVGMSVAAHLWLRRDTQRPIAETDREIGRQLTHYNVFRLLAFTVISAASAYAMIDHPAVPFHVLGVAMLGSALLYRRVLWDERVEHQRVRHLVAGALASPLVWGLLVVQFVMGFQVVAFDATSQSVLATDAIPDSVPRALYVMLSRLPWVASNLLVLWLTLRDPVAWRLLAWSALPAAGWLLLAAAAPSRTDADLWILSYLCAQLAVEVGTTGNEANATSVVAGAMRRIGPVVGPLALIAKELGGQATRTTMPLLWTGPERLALLAEIAAGAGVIAIPGAVAVCLLLRRRSSHPHDR